MTGATLTGADATEIEGTGRFTGSRRAGFTFVVLGGLAAVLFGARTPAGVTARFVCSDGSNDPEFVAHAGPASQGTILTGLFGPATDEFAVHYQTAFGTAPGAYSVDAYDIATIMVTGISSGVTDRGGMIGYFRTYDGQGLAKNYRWDASGELTDPILWLYQVR